MQKGRWRRDCRLKNSEYIENYNIDDLIEANNATGNVASLYAQKALKSQIAMVNSEFRHDISSVMEGNSIYLNNFFCKTEDLTIFRKLEKELNDYAEKTEGSAMISWSKHLKHENPDFSPTFREVLNRLETYFSIEILQSRMNYYRDGTDWKPMHHDSHAYGNKEEDFTAGASFGDSRCLEFLHPSTGIKFSFPQNNGDVFAFTKDVNRKFMHGVPKSSNSLSSRISIIVWGRRKEITGRNGTNRLDEMKNA